MSDYTKATNFAVKDGLPSGNPSKIVKGTEIDTEFNAIQVAVATKGDTGSDTTYNYRANNLSDVANVTTARTNLGVTATGADTTYNYRANNLSDVANASTARGNLVAAKSGANSDITSLSGLTTPLSAAQGGTDLASPGTAGYVLTSTGSGWTSAAPSATDKIQPVTATQASGAVTCGLNATLIDFRSTTLTTGVPNNRVVASPISVDIPSGATLGAVTTVAARIVLLAIDNAGTVELAVVNIAGGNDLSETGLTSTTAISASATAANVVYSTTSRSNVPYRVVGYFDAVNTAGAWGNPTTVQGYGGQALAAMSSLGYGQTWQGVGRASGTTYYNTTGKPIVLSIYGTVSIGTQGTLSVTVNGVQLQGVGNPAVSGQIAYLSVCAIIPPGASYSTTSANLSSGTALELR